MSFRLVAPSFARQVITVLILICLLLLPNSSALRAADPLPTVTNSIGMKLAKVPAGEFVMGTSPEDIRRLSKVESDDRKEKMKDAADQEKLLEQLEGVAALTEAQGPQHKVTVSKPFYVGIHEVTQQDFQTVMGYNPSAHAATGAEKDRLTGRDTKRHPVDSVAWEDAAEFCRQLSSLPAEVAAGRTYRLPTEAEWEYFCRAGTTTNFYWGEGGGPRAKQQREYTALTDTSGKVTWPVGLKEPNPWGLYDLTGNVAEWCSDWYNPKEYQRTKAVDPQGPASGDEKVVRGAAVVWQAHRMRSASRRKFAPETYHKYRGFRVVCEAREAPASVATPPSVAQLEAKLKQKGLTRQGTFYALAEEAEFARYVTALERMRAACFVAQKECNEIQGQLAQVNTAKSDALRQRIAARTYINYSDTWREHWNGVRARRNATDMLVIAELTKDDLKKWQKDADTDKDSAVARFAAQLKVLQDRYKQIQENNRKLVDDTEVQQALAALNTASRSSFKLGPTAAFAAAAKKLETEDAALRQLMGK